MDEGIGAGVGPSERARDAGKDGLTPGYRRRMSARCKQEAVLRLLRGEDLELMSREFGVTAAELSGWRDQFLAVSKASLKSRPADARDAEIGRLKEKAGDLTMATELLKAEIGWLETGRPLARRVRRRAGKSRPLRTGSTASSGSRACGACRGRPSTAIATDRTRPRAGNQGRSARCRMVRRSRRSGSC
jgi:transposase